MAEPISLDEKRRRRALFMNKLYDATDGDSMEFIDYHVLGGELGWTSEEADAVAQYLQKQGLIKFPVFGPVATITHAGVVEVEQSRDRPDDPTDHLAPMNIVLVGRDMHQSQIQTGSAGAVQHQVFNIQDQREVIEAFIREFRTQLDDLPIDPDERQAVEADIVAVEAQLRSPRPRENVTREALRSLRNVTEGVAASGAFLGLVELAQKLPV